MDMPKDELAFVPALAGEGEGGFETHPYDGEMRWPPLIAHG